MQYCFFGLSGPRRQSSFGDVAHSWTRQLRGGVGMERRVTKCVAEEGVG